MVPLLYAPSPTEPGPAAHRSEPAPAPALDGALEGVGPAELAALVEESRRSAARLRVLAEASQLFAEASLELPALLEAVARKIADELGDMLVIWLIAEDGSSLVPAAMRHRDPAGQALLTELLRVARLRPGEGLNARLGAHSVLLTPLSGRGSAFGTLMAARAAGSAPYTEADRDLLEDLARRAGLSIESALLYERERLARREAEQARERLTLLADASTILGSSLDVESTVDSLARLVLPCFADLCMVDLTDPDGELRLAALAHVDPAKERLLRLARERPAAHRAARPAPLAAPLPAQLPTDDRRPLLNCHLTPAPGDHELLQALRRAGARWSILVPLWARSRPLGVLVFGREGGGPAYTEEDLTWADELGRRVAVVIDNTLLYQHAQKAVRLRDDFLGIAGHELRTPLTALQLSLQSLARLPAMERGANDVAARRLASCLRQVDRLGRLINELLDVSRITAGRLSLQPEAVDLVALTRDVLARMADELARAGCPVALDAIEGERLWGRWDRERIDQVLTNLLTNAAKYGRGKPITVSVRRHEGTARLSVRDEGIGIAPEDQARIFERFERAVSERNYGGLGLGLWIVRQIVGAHGGEVRVKSALGEGATFIVDLPFSGEDGPTLG